MQPLVVAGLGKLRDDPMKEPLRRALTRRHSHDQRLAENLVGIEIASVAEQSQLHLEQLAQRLRGRHLAEQQCVAPKGRGHLDGARGLGEDWHVHGVDYVATGQSDASEGGDAPT